MGVARSSTDKTQLARGNKRKKTVGRKKRERRRRRRRKEEKRGRGGKSKMKRDHSSSLTDCRRSFSFAATLRFFLSS